MATRYCARVQIAPVRSGITEVASSALSFSMSRAYAAMVMFCSTTVEFSTGSATQPQCATALSFYPESSSLGWRGICSSPMA